MTPTGPAGRPSGFWIALPEGWVSIDVDPATAARTAARLLDLVVDEGVREHRAAAERLLEHLAIEASATGVTFCACLSTAVGGAVPLQATLTISVNTVEGGNEADALHSALATEPDRVVDVVELDVGRVVRRAGRIRGRAPGTEEELTLLSRQFYVPVPGTSREVALLSFASPTLELEAELCDLFDGMAATFGFTW